jgi:predicted ATP-grasp superfamily ATP-dependent carboligase
MDSRRRQLMLFEWFWGGGLLQDEHTSDPSWRVSRAAGSAIDAMMRQGWEMLEAVAVDFCKIGFEVRIPIDSRLEPPSNVGSRVPIARSDQFVDAIQSTAESVDAILVIAPESAGRLVQAYQWLDSFSEKIIGPELELVRLATDKNATSDFLAQHNIPMPEGFPLPEFLNHHCLSEFPLPAVIKPYDGCGSDEVTYVDNWCGFEVDPPICRWRIERFLPGTPVSAFVIVENRCAVITRPVRQVFDADPIGTFATAADDLPARDRDLATQLAANVAAALFQSDGYCGIDMVVDEAAAHVIELNPRITASYPQLREHSPANLAELMLRSGKRTRSH